MLNTKETLLFLLEISKNCSEYISEVEEFRIDHVQRDT